MKRRDFLTGTAAVAVAAAVPTEAVAEVVEPTKSTPTVRIKSLIDVPNITTVFIGGQTVALLDADRPSAVVAGVNSLTAVTDGGDDVMVLNFKPAVAGEVEWVLD